MPASSPPRLIGLPYDASSSFLRGPVEAPPLIRAALHSTHWSSWTEQGQDLSTPGMLSDAGDLSLSAAADPREAIEAGIAGVLAAGARPIALGGDHSVTYPILRAVSRSYPSLTILHIDAHPDLYDEFEGDRFSHACPFARIMEEGLARRLVQVGIRTMNAHQRSQADRYKVEVIDMPAWAAGTRPSVSGPVYLSIDVDGLDPAFAHGVSHREPGGLSVRDVLTLVQGSGGTLVGADVVEYNPRQDLGGVTATVAAKMVKEIAGRMLAGQGRKAPGGPCTLSTGAGSWDTRIKLKLCSRVEEQNPLNPGGLMSARVEIPIPPRPAESRARTMAAPWVPVEPRWEYKEVIRDIETEGLPTETELNALGGEHWELAGVVPAGDRVHFYFKRERIR
jgi:arginase